MGRRRRMTFIAALLSVAAVCAVNLLPATGAQKGARFRPYLSLTGGWAEPGVVVGSGSWVYVDAPPGKLWRSGDNGRSFRQVRFGPVADALLLAGGGDSDTLVRGARVYYADLWLGSNTILRSDDRGDTWTQMTPISTLGLSDRQWLALGPRDKATKQDTLYAVYALIEPPYQVMFARSSDSGLTWDFHRPVPAWLGARDYTGPLVSQGSFLAFPWIDGTTLSVSYSKDRGTSWNTTVVSERADNGSFPVAALDRTRLHVVWEDSVRHDIRIATSTDRGKRFGRHQVVSGPDVAVFPWVAARDGKVAVAWYGARVAKRVRSDDVPSNTVWHARYSESLDRGKRFSAPISAGPGTTGPICTSGLACDGGRELGDYLSVDLLINGDAIVAFGGQVPGAIKVARQRR